MKCAHFTCHACPPAEDATTITKERNELYAMLASVAKNYDSVAYTAWTPQMHAVRDLLDRMKRETP